MFINRMNNDYKLCFVQTSCWLQSTLRDYWGRAIIDVTFILDYTLRGLLIEMEKVVNMCLLLNQFTICIHYVI